MLTSSSTKEIKMQEEVCPDCKGTKQYVGLLAVEECRTCCQRVEVSQGEVTIEMVQDFLNYSGRTPWYSDKKYKVEPIIRADADWALKIRSTGVTTHYYTNDYILEWYKEYVT